MLFKLSFRNIKKSFKDYTIYFLTLVLGIAIFYLFNSIDSQQAMLEVSESTRNIVKLMIAMLGYVSVFVAIVLGFLIVYANNFLIKRRKREFGVYMLLGMGKKQISKVLFLETILVGILSLAVGMLIGVFGSQLMSILVAKIFEADMSQYEFVFSEEACLKTILYFAVMYVAVMLFNTVSISKYKLIDLLTAVKKNEAIKIKNPWICIMVFIVAVVMLGVAYYQVTAGISTLDTEEKLLIPIALGTVGTFLTFWSLSGFILTVVQKKKNTYLKDVNMFVLRQLNNKINTTVTSITIICLMLFMTITVLSSSLSLKESMTKDIKEMTPVDVNLYKTVNLPDNGKFTKEQIEDSKQSIQNTLKENGFDMKQLKEMVEIPIYATNELQWKDFLKSIYEEVKEQNPRLLYDTAETIIKVSDYNKIAKLYGIQEYQLQPEEYIMLCDFNNMKEIRNRVLQKEGTITLQGKTLHPKYKECKEGYVLMSTSHTNTGIILVSDEIPLEESMKEQVLLAANYNAETEEQIREIETALVSNETGLATEISRKGIQIDGISKISIMEASVGIATIITFISIYLGIIFLIASSAILALKELTESSDNKQRYTILRKIGADESMINKALFKQIGIFFLVPLALAIIHSIFGIQFLLKILSVQVKPEELLPSIISTVIFFGVIYGAYFVATYSGSKNMIRGE